MRVFALCPCIFSLSIFAEVKYAVMFYLRKNVLKLKYAEIRMYFNIFIRKIKDVKIYDNYQLLAVVLLSD